MHGDIKLDVMDPNGLSSDRTFNNQWHHSNYTLVDCGVLPPIQACLCQEGKSRAGRLGSPLMSDSRRTMTHTCVHLHSSTFELVELAGAKGIARKAYPVLA